jgi:hypothetical protein
MSAGTLNGKSLALQALTVNGVAITGHSTGVSTLNGLSNAVQLTSTAETLIITPTGQNINLEVKPLDVNTIVESITTTLLGAPVLRGAITFSSSDNSINLASTGGGDGNMDFSVNFPDPPPAGVASLQTLTGPITLTSSDNSVNFAPDVDTGDINLTVNFPTPPEAGVVSLQTLTGPITLTSSDNSVNFSPDVDTGDIDITVNFPTPPDPGVANLNSLTGAITLTSPTGSISVNPNGQNIELDANFPVTTISAGDGINIDEPTPGQFVVQNFGVIQLTAGSNIELTGTQYLPTINATVPPSTLVISDYTSTAGTLALTGTFAAQGSTTLTTTLDSAPINVFGNLNVFHPTGGGGGDADVEARIVIGTTPQQIGPTITQTIANAHYDTIPLIYKGIGPTTAGNVNILLQARVVSGSVNRVSAQVMAIGQMNNA